MKILVIFHTALFLCFLTLIQVADAGTSCSVSGVVTDQGGNPLPHSDVIVSGTSRGASAAPDGRFFIRGLEPGRYEIAASRVGFKRVAKRIDLKVGREAELTFALPAEPLLLEELVVTAKFERAYPSPLLVEKRAPATSIVDSGELLKSIPGVSTVKKGATGQDPVLRGFRQDQVLVLLDGAARTTCACPNRMDPPTSHIQVEDIEKIELFKGPFTVRYGETPGGLINIVLKRPDVSGSLFKGRVDFGYEPDHDGIMGRLSATTAFDDRFAVFLGGGYREEGDYRDGDDNVVRAGAKVSDYSLKGRFDPTSRLRFQATLRSSDTRDVPYPALMMDMDKDIFKLYSLDISSLPPGGPVESLGGTVYMTTLDHGMSNNESKTNYSKVHAVADIEASTFGGRCEARLKPAASGAVWTGFDFLSIWKNGTRFKDFVSPQKTDATDKIWPDATQNRIGLFAESRLPLSEDVSVLAGLRAGWALYEAAEADSSFLAYSSGSLESTNFLPAGDISLLWRATPGWEIGLSAGAGSRAPSLTEKYINRFQIGLDSYEYLGDPGIEPEINYQTELSAAFSRESLEIGCSAYIGYLYNAITGFVDTLSSDPDPVVVKRFGNLDKARHAGGELSAAYRFDIGYYMSSSLSYTRGTNLVDDEPLPEMPPLEANVVLGYEHWRKRVRIELDGRFAARQNRVSSLYGEEETPGFSVFGGEIELRLLDHFRVIAGIDNIFDEQYYEHLSRREKIADGEPIPEEGRNVYTRISFSW